MLVDIVHIYYKSYYLTVLAVYDIGAIMCIHVFMQALPQMIHLITKTQSINAAQLYIH